MKYNRSNLIIDISQIIMWVCVFLLPPVIIYIFLLDISSFWWTLKIMTNVVVPVYFTYLLNYHLLIPKLLFRQRKALFFIINTALVAATVLIYIAPGDFVNAIPRQLNVEVPKAVISAGYAGFRILILVFQLMVILLAVGLCYAKKWNDEKQKMEEERRHHAEAELDWLKSQLNPHFLFNTLNNISSLTQTDADKAQESISQLSGLLRYALYESKGQLVRIAEEIGFMENYIDLMSLRCSSATKVSKRFDVADRNGLIAPLLFISLIENAFKHGTSSHNQSFVSVEMFPEGDTLVFRCSNSLLEKPKTADYRGSGIGVENTRRRLELIYPDSHSYEQTTDNQTYTVTVKLFHTLKPCAE